MESPGTGARGGPEGDRRGTGGGGKLEGDWRETGGGTGGELEGELEGDKKKGGKPQSLRLTSLHL